MKKERRVKVEKRDSMRHGGTALSMRIVGDTNRSQEISTVNLISASDKTRLLSTFRFCSRFSLGTVSMSLQKAMQGNDHHRLSPSPSS